MRRARSFLRGLLIIVVGLGAAFGVFRALGWPSTLETDPGDRVSLGTVNAGELLHSETPFKVVGSKPVNITSVRVVGDLTGLEVVSVRVGPVPIGSVKGPNPEIEALPPASGSELEAGVSGFFVVTFRVTRPGISGFDGLKIGYRSGWLSRSTTAGPRVSASVPGTPSPTPSARPSG